MLVIDGTQPALQAAVAEKARDKGIQVLLNASQLSGGMGELLSLSDIVIAPSALPTSSRPRTTWATACARFSTSAARRTANHGRIRRGWPRRHEAGRAGSPRHFVADTSGAGDAFAGAFAFAHMRGWPSSEPSLSPTPPRVSCVAVSARASALPRWKKPLPRSAAISRDRGADAATCWARRRVPGRKCCGKAWKPHWAVRRLVKSESSPTLRLLR